MEQPITPPVDADGHGSHSMGAAVSPPEPKEAEEEEKTPKYWNGGEGPRKKSGEQENGRVVGGTIPAEGNADVVVEGGDGTAVVGPSEVAKTPSHEDTFAPIGETEAEEIGEGIDVDVVTVSDGANTNSGESNNGGTEVVTTPTDASEGGAEVPCAEEDRETADGVEVKRTAGNGHTGGEDDEIFQNGSNEEEGVAENGVEIETVSATGAEGKRDTPIEVEGVVAEKIGIEMEKAAPQQVPAEEEDDHDRMELVEAALAGNGESEFFDAKEEELDVEETVTEEEGKGDNVVAGAPDSEEFLDAKGDTMEVEGTMRTAADDNEKEERTKNDGIRDKGASKDDNEGFVTEPPATVIDLSKGDESDEELVVLKPATAENPDSMETRTRMRPPNDTDNAGTSDQADSVVKAVTEPAHDSTSAPSSVAATASSGAAAGATTPAKGSARKNEGDSNSTCGSRTSTSPSPLGIPPVLPQATFKKRLDLSERKMSHTSHAADVSAIAIAAAAAGKARRLPQAQGYASPPPAPAHAALPVPPHIPRQPPGVTPQYYDSYHHTAPAGQHPWPSSSGVHWTPYQYHATAATQQQWPQQQQQQYEQQKRHYPPYHTAGAAPQQQHYPSQSSYAHAPSPAVPAQQNYLAARVAQTNTTNHMVQQAHQGAKTAFAPVLAGPRPTVQTKSKHPSGRGGTITMMGDTPIIPLDSSADQKKKPGVKSNFKAVAATAGNGTPTPAVAEAKNGKREKKAAAKATVPKRPPIRHNVPLIGRPISDFTPEEIQVMPCAFAYNVGDGKSKELAESMALKYSREIDASMPQKSVPQKKKRKAPSSAEGGEKKKVAVGRQPGAKPQGPKAQEIYSGPPDPKELPGGWPPGWKKKVYKRMGGATKHRPDRYWYTPKTEKKLRSMVEVKRFLAALEEVGGDEDKAYHILKRGR